DPGDVGRESAEALVKAVAEAKPFLEFRLDRVLARADLHSVQGRARAAETAVAVIAEHPSDFVRDQYLMKVAGPTRTDESLLRQHLARAGSGAPARRGDARAAPAPAAGSHPGGAEIEALRLAVHHPDTVAQRLEGVLFTDEVHLAAFQALCAAPTLDQAIAQARPDAAALLQRLAVEEAGADPDDVIRLLVAAAVQRVISRLRADARASAAPTDYAPTIAWLKVTGERLWDDATSVEASGQLVPWLVQFALEGE
ncbi:MAG TPA: hypothetical protein VFO65_00605, partial [Acidimicrobiales bacterium]|nr:hypothetical protein [Acidimicrobiales bacterium]